LEAPDLGNVGLVLTSSYRGRKPASSHRGQKIGLTSAISSQIWMAFRV
jgi:hypothetical protein